MASLETQLSAKEQEISKSYGSTPSVGNLKLCATEKSFIYLRAVSVRSGICHRQNSRSGVLEIASDFILKLSTVAGLPSPASACRVSSLDHEVLDHSVEHCVIVVP